jgi:short-subunit dehydrogenase
MAHEAGDARRDFEGRTVLVTGASQGIGRAVARAFHEAGANVVMVARRREPLAQAAAGLERALVHAADVADLASMRTIIGEAVARFGGIDGLVNNAGVHFRGPFERRAPEEIAAMVDVNLRAPMVLTSLALPHLRRHGGFVVNVSSLAGKLPLDGATAYSATKFGLRIFTMALARELRGSGVTVSAVCPGPVDTGFIMNEIDQVEDIVFSQRMCTAEDVAGMVLACARDGRVERAYPPGASRLATLGYLLPGLRERFRPALSRKGRRVKERLRERRRG